MKRPNNSQHSSTPNHGPPTRSSSRITVPRSSLSTAFTTDRKHLKRLRSGITTKKPGARSQKGETLPGFWLLAPGSWLLAPGSWLLAPGFWLPAPGLPAPGFRLLASGFWLLRHSVGHRVHDEIDSHTVRLA